MNTVGFVRRTEVLIAQPGRESEFPRGPIGIAHVCAIVVLDKRAHLRSTLRKWISVLVELVGMKIVVHQAEQYRHAFGDRSRVSQLGVGILGLHVRGHGILNVGPQADQLRRAKSIAGKRRRVLRRLVLNESEDSRPR